MTRFVAANLTLQFNCNPLRPARKQSDLRQLRETDSNGSAVVYGKGQRVTVYSLVFARLPTAVRDDLLFFFGAEVFGQRHPFTWIDHAEVSRPARLIASSVRTTPVGPNQHRAELEIEVSE